MSALQGSQTVEIGKLPEYYVWEVLKIPRSSVCDKQLMLLHLVKAEATKNLPALLKFLLGWRNTTCGGTGIE